MSLFNSSKVLYDANGRPMSDRRMLGAILFITLSCYPIAVKPFAIFFLT